ncbi:MAG: hypothetical protein QM796_13750 [Chthoniobacteraceae bacterium]
MISHPPLGSSPGKNSAKLRERLSFAAILLGGILVAWLRITDFAAMRQYGWAFYAAIAIFPSFAIGVGPRSYRIVGVLLLVGIALFGFHEFQRYERGSRLELHEERSESKPKIRRRFSLKLLDRLAAIQAAGSDPIAAAESPEQLRFLKAYLAVLDEERLKLKGEPHPQDTAFPWMESLRRCGIVFPEGTSVRLLPVDPPLQVISDPATMKQIEALMDLKAE